MIPFLANAIRMLPGAFRFSPLDDALVGRALAPRLSTVKNRPFVHEVVDNPFSSFPFSRRYTMKHKGLVDDLDDTGYAVTPDPSDVYGPRPAVFDEPEDLVDWQTKLLHSRVVRNISDDVVDEPSIPMMRYDMGMDDIHPSIEDVIGAMAKSGDDAQRMRDNFIRSTRLRDRMAAPIPLPTWVPRGNVPVGTPVGEGYRRMHPQELGMLRYFSSVPEESLNKAFAPFSLTSSPRNFVDDIALTGTPIGRGAGRAGRTPLVTINRGPGQPVTRLFPSAFHAHNPRLSAGMSATDARIAPHPYFHALTPPGMAKAPKHWDVFDLAAEADRRTQSRWAMTQLLNALDDAATQPPRWGNMFTSTNPF